MPKPEDEDEDLIEEDIELEDELDDEDELEVDLDTVDDTEDEKQKRDNKAFAAMRIENKRLKEEYDRLRDERDNRPDPEPVHPVPNTDDPSNWNEKQWDELAEKDWKQAVDLRSQINAQKVMQDQTRVEKANKVLVDSKQKVLSRHPELNDGNSEKSKIFKQILSDNPEYINQAKGPVWAMRDMEEYMKDTLGYKDNDIVSAEKRGAQREVARQSRISVSSQQGRSGGEGKVVKLSRDDLDFCKHNDIDPKEFAKNKHKIEKSGKEGVQV